MRIRGNIDLRICQIKEVLKTTDRFGRLSNYVVVGYGQTQEELTYCYHFHKFSSPAAADFLSGDLTLPVIPGLRVNRRSTIDLP